MTLNIRVWCEMDDTAITEPKIFEATILTSLFRELTKEEGKKAIHILC
jgi:hypothetical protein